MKVLPKCQLPSSKSKLVGRIRCRLGSMAELLLPRSGRMINLRPQFQSFRRKSLCLILQQTKDALEKCFWQMLRWGTRLGKRLLFLLQLTFNLKSERRYLCQNVVIRRKRFNRALLIRLVYSKVSRDRYQ